MWARNQVAAILVLASLVVSASAVVFVASTPPTAGLVPFQNYAELSDFVTGARASQQTSSRGSGLIAGPAAGPNASPAMGAPSAPSAPSYSGTNVQVAGVDELDMVKTDGTYLYIVTQGELDILLAYPATDLHVVSRISLGNLTQPVTGSNATYSVGLFLSGTKLLAVADAYRYAWGLPAGIGIPSVWSGSPAMAPSSISLVIAPQMTFAFLFDVTDPSQPVLEHTVAISGTASTGRMVGSTVYLVANEWIPQANGTFLPPQFCIDGTCRALAPEEIYRDPQSQDAWDYTNLLALDLATGSSKPMSVVTGGYSILYMSPTALYLAFYKWIVPSAGPLPMLMPIQTGASWTTIYKLVADGLSIHAVASGNVAGSLLNQYSMDEWNGYLRVATTVRDFTENGTIIRNNVYVFDPFLQLLGSVTGLAPGESIFAVRFLGDRAYVVTFRKIDPLFVINLSDPTRPKVSGFLEMPGFSEYLYPLDAGHLLGVGKDALPAQEGNWSWYQGLKLGLYNVTNATTPSETANVTIGDRGTQSEVLNDPHAFLYVPDRHYIVLPVDLAIVDPSQYPDGVPPYAWGQIVWQGAYVYRVNATTGFQYIGRIAHGNGTVNETYGWYSSPRQIRRSLYIGDVLYTISETEVQANSLADLSEVASVVYASPPACQYYCPIAAA